MPGIHKLKKPPEQFRDGLTAHQEDVYVNVFNSMLDSGDYSNGQVYAGAMSRAQDAPEKAPKSYSTSFVNGKSMNKKLVSKKAYRAALAAKQLDLNEALLILSSLTKTMFSVQQEINVAYQDFEDMRFISVGDSLQQGFEAVPRLISVQAKLKDIMQLADEITIILESAKMDIRGEQIATAKEFKATN